MKKFLIIMLLALTACSLEKRDLADSIVSITNMAENSGGTGSIVQVDKKTVILTNGHVCAVVAKGGLVHTADGQSHLVTGYRLSTIHDLCAISIAQKLSNPLFLSSRHQNIYDDVTVAGHPKLLPTIVTLGHLSDRRIVTVLAGFRPCTPEETESPNTALFCAMIGKLPLVKRYEANVVSALIQPGSSGSPVLNANGDIAQVIFAGSGDIGFGIAVPQEYVTVFLRFELESLPKIVPNSDLDFADMASRRNENNEVTKQFEDLCRTKVELTGNELCKEILSSTGMNDLIYRR